MVTCKKFLEELNNFLDSSLDPSLRSEIEKHLDQCPNCFVICDTTKKTINVYKGMKAKVLPELANPFGELRAGPYKLTSKDNVVPN